MPAANPTRRRWVSVNDVADYLGVSTRTIFKMVEDGRLNAYRNGSQIIRLDLDDVDAAMQPRTEDADLAALKLENYIAKTLAAAPPLNDEQRNRIAALLRVGGGA
jgi:excisionase family DNA binding protein